MKKYLFLFSIILVLIVGVVIGYVIFKPQAQTVKVDSLVIYNKLQNQGFLVTQDYVLEQKLSIDNSSGTWWKDIFWGQQIEASAVMKVSLGVDLKKLLPADVRVGNEIMINLPAIEVQSVEIVGDINLQNKQGVLKKLFNNDDGYNQALAQLKDSARSAALSTEIVQSARQETIKEIGRLVNLIVENKQVAVSFKLIR